MKLTKTLFCLAALLWSASISVSGQQKSDNQKHNNTIDSLAKHPTFQGGDIETFRRWIMENLRYPEIAQENNIQGRVILSFVITPQGKIGECDILLTPDRSLTQEVIRVLFSSPEWTPGIDKNNNLVAVRYTMPIDFNLTNDYSDNTNKSDTTRNNTSHSQNNYALSAEDEPIEIATFPTFQGGGLDKFRRWVMQNLRYPEVAWDNNIQGTVVISFVINTKGKVENITLLESPDHSLSAEAVRVVRLSPAWMPCLDKNNKPVKIKYTVPIAFRLEEDTTMDQRMPLPSKGTYNPRTGLVEY